MTARAKSRRTSTHNPYAKRKRNSFKARVANIKKKRRELKKEIKRLKKEAKSIATAAETLYDRGFDTMYIKVEGGDVDWKPRFRGFVNMMGKLEHIMCIDDGFLQSLDEEATAKE